MLDWLRKLLDYHVCEEFTRWQTHEATYSRPATLDERICADLTVVEYTRRWQERTCTICGRIEQRDLERSYARRTGKVIRYPEGGDR